MIELATWNSTIPVGTPAKVIDTPRLLDCYIDQYFRSGDSLFFWSPQIPPVGASLLAMVECQPTSLLDVPPSSRASPAPTGSGVDR